MPENIALGIDPGLRNTGCVAVRSDGPAPPILLLHETLRAARAPSAIWMRQAILAWIADARARLEVFGRTLDVIAIETFQHRPWLRAADGSARRVGTSPEMGKIIGYLLGALETGGIPVLEVSPLESKAGYPANERYRRAMLPDELANVHERDAYLAAALGLRTRKLVP